MNLNNAVKMGPVDRKPCRDCGKGLFRGQRRLASTLQPWLVMLDKCKRDGDPYTFLDVFCNACRKKIQKGERGFGPLMETIPIMQNAIAENVEDMRTGSDHEDASFANEDGMEAEMIQMDRGESVRSEDPNENSVCNIMFLLLDFIGLHKLLNVPTASDIEHTLLISVPSTSKRDTRYS